VARGLNLGILTLFDVFHFSQDFEGFISGIAEVGENVCVAVDIETVGVIQYTFQASGFFLKYLALSFQRDMYSWRPE